MRNKFLLLMIFGAGFCLAADSSGTKFRLSAGIGGEYIFALRYESQFGSTTQYSTFSKGALNPSLNIGVAINSRFSLFAHYSHYLVYDEQSDEKIQQMSYLAVGSMVVPSEKLSNFYLSYSLGILQYWLPIQLYSLGLKAFGGGTTVACGYLVNNHFRVQIDMDYLAYGMSASINRTTIDPNDSTNTIRNLGSSSFGDNWFNISLGLSSYWDIF
jgi:hypothetical protein